MVARQITLRSLTVMLWADRWLIVAIVICAVAASVGYSLTRKSQYESEALLVPAKSEGSSFGALSALAGQFAGIGALAGLGGGQGSDVDETVAVLKSRQFTDAFLTKHNVMPQLFPERWDPATNNWKVVENSPTKDASAVASPSPQKAFERFDKLRDVVVDRRTNHIRLKVRAQTPELAQSLVAAMIADLNDTMRDAALEEARLSVAALTKRMESEQIESVRLTSAKLLETNLQRQILAETRKEYAVRVLDPPPLPEERVYPRRKRMVIIGFIVGVAFGVLGSFARRAWVGLRSA